MGSCDLERCISASIEMSRGKEMSFRRVMNVKG
jgi:hypothetical protein